MKEPQLRLARVKASELRTELLRRGAEFWPVPPESIAGTLPTPLDHVASLLGIVVDFREEILGTVDGSSVAGIWDPSARRISISKKFPVLMTRFTFAHEIGHSVLHRTMQSLHRDRILDGGLHCQAPKRPPEEREADAFATELLMPAEVVNEIFQILYRARISPDDVDP
jgi:hypothetical protein